MNLQTLLVARYGNTAVDIVKYFSTRLDLELYPSRPDALDFYNIPGGSTVRVEVVPVTKILKAKEVAKEILNKGAWVDDGRDGRSFWEAMHRPRGGGGRGGRAGRENYAAGRSSSSGAGAAAAAATVPI